MASLSNPTSSYLYASPSILRPKLWSYNLDSTVKRSLPLKIHLTLSILRKPNYQLYLFHVSYSTWIFHPSCVFDFSPHHTSFAQSIMLHYPWKTCERLRSCISLATLAWKEIGLWCLMNSFALCIWDLSMYRRQHGDSTYHQKVHRRLDDKLKIISTKINFLWKVLKKYLM